MESDTKKKIGTVDLRFISVDFGAPMSTSHNYIPCREIDTVIYHSPCLDGFGAAYAAWRVLKDNATYIPHRIGAPVPPGLVGRNIAIVDLSFKMDIIKQLLEAGNRIIVVDHHISALKELSKLDPQYKFRNIDIYHSGAVLSWMYFNGSEENNGVPVLPVPPLIKYIEDHDLWKFDLPHSRDIAVSLQIMPFNFQEFDKLVEGGEEAVNKLILEGQAMRRFVSYQVEQVCKRATLCTLKKTGHICWVSNSPSFVNEIGEALASRGLKDDNTYPSADFALVYNYNHIAEQFSISLRAVNDKVDLSVVAEQFGGGGHKRASGFRHLGDSIFDIIERIEINEENDFDQIEENQAINI